MPFAVGSVGMRLEVHVSLDGAAPRLQTPQVHVPDWQVCVPEQAPTVHGPVVPTAPLRSAPGVQAGYSASRALAARSSRSSVLARPSAAIDSKSGGVVPTAQA